MSFIEWLAQPACRILTLTLFHFLWQALIVVFGFIAIVKLCNVSRPSTRYACSLAALVAVTLCPIGTLIWNFFGDGGPTFTQVQESAKSSTFGLNFIARPDEAHLSMSYRWAGMLQPYLLALWFCGVVFFGSRLLAGTVGIAKLRRSRIPISRDLATRVERLGTRLRMNAAGLVFLSNHVTDAMALGLVRKLVLIPAAWATEMPPDMLEAVIAHELAHLRRLDLWANLLQRVVETLFFYHPAVWWLSRRLRIERELCSDELAVAAIGDRLVYARTLEHIAAGRQPDIRPALAALLRGERNMPLLQRIRYVLALSATNRRHWPAGLAAFGLAACLWTLSFTLLHTLSPTAYAAQEPAHDEASSGDNIQTELVLQKTPAVEVQTELVLQKNPTVEVELTSDDSEIIDRKVAEIVKKALAEADELKQKELDKAARKVEEKLEKVRLHHIRLENDARDQAIAVRGKVEAPRAGEKAKQAKNRFYIQLNEDGAVLLPADENEKAATARYHILLEDGEQQKAIIHKRDDEQIEELTAMVKKLSVQVDRLSKELKELQRDE
jgi:beta-lactamase regulating signal transducer with metallopeptidase domain